ncbi:TPA: hypothetical protein ACH3X2_008869 [Trebouxia sp. C0005]
MQSAAPTALPTAKPALVLQRPSVSFNAGNGLPARPHSNLAAASGCSSNVLYAVIALLGDLDESSLHIVKAEARLIERYLQVLAIEEVRVARAESAKQQAALFPVQYLDS